MTKKEIEPCINLWCAVMLFAIRDAMTTYDGKYFLDIDYFKSEEVKPIIELMRHYGKMYRIYWVGLKYQKDKVKQERFQEIVRLINR